MSDKRNPAMLAIEKGTRRAPVAPGSAPPDAAPAQAAEPAKSPGRDVAKVMLYLPPKVARKFKEIAFHEDRKAHDVYLAAIDAYLVAQGHGGLKGVVES